MVFWRPQFYLQLRSVAFCSLLLKCDSCFLFFLPPSSFFFLPFLVPTISYCIFFLGWFSAQLGQLTERPSGHQSQQKERDRNLCLAVRLGHTLPFSVVSEWWCLLSLYNATVWENTNTLLLQVRCKGRSNPYLAAAQAVPMVGQRVYFGFALCLLLSLHLYFHK